ncbi:hypothetical protein Gpo141_00011635 [Globisporangium polare]
MMQLSNPHVPFSGVGNSAMGAYHDRLSFEAFSHRKTVIYKYIVLDLQQRYPPDSKASERVLRIVQYPVSAVQFQMAMLLVLAVVAAIVGKA